MLVLQPNHFYKCAHHLLIYPSKETASSAARGGGGSVAVGTGANATAYRSTALGCKVSSSERNSIFLVLENKEPYIKVLFGDKLGWIIHRDWLDITQL